MEKRDFSDVDQLILGDHACLLYSELEEYRKIAAKYVVNGLLRNEKVMCIIHDYERNLCIADLEAEKNLVNYYITRGQLIITNTKYVYSSNIGLDVNKTISFWIEEINKMRHEGFNGIRVLAEMNALSGSQNVFENLMEYEMLANRGLTKEAERLSLCVFNKKKFPIYVLEDMVKKHNAVLANGRLIKPNPYFISFREQVKEKEERFKTRNYFGLSLDDYDNGAEVENSSTDMEILRHVLRATGDGVWEWNVTNNSVYVSSSLLSMLGLRKDAITDIYSIMKLIHIHDLSDYYNKVEGCIKNQMDHFKHEVRIRNNNDGGWVWIRIKGVPIEKDANGQIVKIVGLVNNIDESKNIERELEEKIYFEKLRTDFFANLSHELRTPLNVILASLQLQELYINEDKSNDNYNKYCKINDRMKRNCYRLLRLINNLIDITKIDAGFYNLNFTNYDVVGLVKSIVLSVEDYIHRQQLKIFFKSNENRIITSCDPEKIERVILNLLSNAIKFTNAGGTLEVSVNKEKDKVYILVKDTGIGVSKEKLPNIFDRFVQADKTLARNKEGSGIGLSLVKSLVEMHEGQITVESQINKGTTFTIILPMRESDEIQYQEEIYINCKTNVERIHIEFSDIYV